MHKPLGYFVAALIGAVIFVIVGYFVTGREFSFGFWLERPIHFHVYLWALLGLAIGAGFRFVSDR